MPKVLFLLVLLSAALLSGCATGGTAANDSSAAPVDANGNRVSNIPWNTPASWEGGGALGGAMGH